jgi:hypothetical protein
MEAPAEVDRKSFERNFPVFFIVHILRQGLLRLRAGDPSMQHSKKYRCSDRNRLTIRFYLGHLFD